MIIEPSKYSEYFNFIKTFSPCGFKEIEPDTPFIQQLELMTERNDQFFIIADLIQMKVIYSSKRSTQMIGVEPEYVTPYHFFEATHPDDIERHKLARSKLFGIGHELFISEQGDGLLSTNFKIRNREGGYSNLLFQDYLYYTTIPYRIVYVLQVHTNIDWCKKMKKGYHYYIGNDLSYFRYPDEELLLSGNILTDREFEIIKLVYAGLTSEQIAEKLFLSKHTINTHRNNILGKTGKTHISDLIYELQERGLL